MLLGGPQEFSSLIGVSTSYHTHQNILRDKEWCINITDATMPPTWDRTIRNNRPDNDELTDAGFTTDRPPAFFLLQVNF